MEKNDIAQKILNICQEIQEVIKADVLPEKAGSPLYELATMRLVDLGADINRHINGLKGFRFVDFKGKSLKTETKKPLNPDEIENKNTTFFKKKVVFTGNLVEYPNREEIASLLRKYGADVNSSISGKTDIVIKGEGAGPSKMKKIQELQAKGSSIRVIEEPEFLKILKEENIK